MINYFIDNIMPKHKIDCSKSGNILTKAPEGSIPATSLTDNSEDHLKTFTGENNATFLFATNNFGGPPIDCRNNFIYSDTVANPEGLQTAHRHTESYRPYSRLNANGPHRKVQFSEHNIQNHLKHNELSWPVNLPHQDLNQTSFYNHQRPDCSPSLSSCFTTYEALGINSENLNSEFISKGDHLPIFEGCTQMTSGSSVVTQSKKNQPKTRNLNGNRNASHSKSDICDRFPNPNYQHYENKHCSYQIQYKSNTHFANFTYPENESYSNTTHNESPPLFCGIRKNNGNKKESKNTNKGKNKNYKSFETGSLHLDSFPSNYSEKSSINSPCEFMEHRQFDTESNNYYNHCNYPLYYKKRQNNLNRKTNSFKSCDAREPYENSSEYFSRAGTYNGNLVYQNYQNNQVYNSKILNKNSEQFTKKPLQNISQEFKNKYAHILNPLNPYKIFSEVSFSSCSDYTYSEEYYEREYMNQSIFNMNREFLQLVNNTDSINNYTYDQDYYSLEQFYSNPNSAFKNSLIDGNYFLKKTPKHCIRTDINKFNSVPPVKSSNKPDFITNQKKMENFNSATNTITSNVNENTSKSNILPAWPFKNKLFAPSIVEKPSSTFVKTSHNSEQTFKHSNKGCDKISVKEFVDNTCHKSGVDKVDSNTAANLTEKFDANTHNAAKTAKDSSTSTPDEINPTFLFGSLLIKLHTKLSANCRCQFEVWEAEAFVCAEPLVTFNNLESDNLALNNFHKLITQLSENKDTPNIRFALKFFEHKDNEKSKQKYKLQSIEREGMLLKQIDYQIHNKDKVLEGKEDNHNSMYMKDLSSISNTPDEILQKLSKSDKTLPTPLYLWYAKGINLNTGNSVWAVAMEMISGKSFTVLLSGFQKWGTLSNYLLLLDIALKFVESQRILAEELPYPIINWDTKPGNILVKFVRSSTTGKVHCRKVVIIDIGDALPGPNYWFGSRHGPEKAPCYIICTKGHCSPECAIMVFLLASGSNSKNNEFRQFWFGPDATAEQFQSIKKKRIALRWKDWIKYNFLRKGSALSEDTSIHSGTKSDASILNSISEINKIFPASNGTTSTKTSSHTHSENMHDKSFNSDSTELEQSEVKKSTLNQDLAISLPESNLQAQIKLRLDEKLKERLPWEVNICSKSVVFNTGLILAQIFGGPSVLKLVEKDEVHAVDVLCEWDCHSEVNLLSGKKNLGPKDLLPTEGMFSEPPWKEFIETLLCKCLAFLPSDRWTFSELEDYLRLMKSSIVLKED